MTLIGITGGVGMGKSTAQGILEDRGLPIVDTDHLARRLVRPGEPALAEIQRQFGARFIAADGTLRRRELADLVFADSSARHQLEAILHPRIRSGWLAEAARWRQSGAALGAVVIPLLFETDAASCFDAVVCVACSAAVQQERLRARQWSALEIERRLAAQWPVERKLAAARHVVWTDGSLAVHAAQWDRVLAAL